MKTTTGLVISLAALLAFPACGGDDDDGGPVENAALVSAFPAEGFVGRTTMVALAGEDTSFSSASTVSFGDGVTVNSVTAQGSTSLIVEIVVDAAAATGPRDITVDGLTLSNGISLSSPVAAVIQGRVGQGGLAIIDIENLDLTNPFDDSTDEGGNPIGVTATAAGTAPLVATVTGSSINMTLAVNLDAAPGDVNVEIVSGGLTSVVPVTIEAFTPKTLADLNTGSITNAFDTDVYEVTAAEAAVLGVLNGTSTAADSDPIVFALDATGNFETGFLGSASANIFGPNPFSANLQPNDTVYLVVWDNTGAAGYDFTFETALSPLTNTITDTEPNDTSATAQAVILPGGVIDGTLVNSGALDQNDNEIPDSDFYSVTIGAGDVGKRLAVSTAKTNSDPMDSVDTIIEVIDTNGTNVLGASGDGGIYDVVIGPSFAVEGTYFVRVSFAFGLDSETATFNTAMSLVDALPE